MPATLLLLHPLPAWGYSRLTQDLSHAEQHPLLHGHPGIWTGAGPQQGSLGLSFGPQRRDNTQPRSLVVLIMLVVSERSWRVGSSRSPSCLGCVPRAESGGCGTTL